MKNEYNILIWRLKEKGYLWDIGADGRVILKWILKMAKIHLAQNGVKW
jgi:hypothetical protein